MAERCIYADDFLDLFHVASAGQDKMFVKVVEQVVEDTPTVDVVEVKRGKWLNIIFTQRYECSLCGNEIYFGKDKFCSECGAKMDGASKERGEEK